MWARMALALLFAGCGAEPATPRPTPEVRAVEVRTEPRPVPTGAVARGELAGAPSHTGVLFQVAEAAPAIARLIEPCFDGASLPLALTLRAGVDEGGALTNVALEPADPARLACVAAALADARLPPPGDPMLGSVELRLRFVERTEPRAPFAFPGEPWDLCADDGGCVLVTGGCTGPAAATHRRASALARANEARLAVATCGPAVGPPVVARCRASVCATEPSDHPEWRACQRDAECVNVERGCGGWDVVGRRFEREARAAFAAEPGRCDRASDPDDTWQARCRYGFCAYEWRDP